VARRLGRRGWRDARLLFGVLLILVSVVIGARLFATADQSTGWVAARSDLPAGHVVAAVDLTTVDARLATATAARYYPARRLRDLVGATLARSVGAGELVSGTDFAGPGTPATRLVPVLVKPGRLPEVAPGDHVDVYAYQPSGAAGQAGAGQAGGVGTPAAGGTGAEVLVLHDVEAVAVAHLATGEVSLTLRVAVDAAIRAVAASQGDRVDVVVLAPDGQGGVGDTGPTVAPGYGQ
jgi:hypothetical protein